ncbi:MAG: hypothetical protein B5M53_02575 [Candidatus Cloacimonas sp. 4484_209]|nr:MAG: hypothetical protein B5M53_02575 [Candidatus Cloacimonas sp. 4484_209]
MKVIFVGKWLPGYRKLRHPEPNLSQEAKLRLKWMDYYQNHGNNASLTSRHFAISRKTLYKWKKDTIHTI